MKRYDNDLLDPSLRPAILVSGGPQPEPALLVRLREKLPQAPLLCADRGADLCRAAGVVPDGLIGDMDSLSAATRDWLEETGVPEVVYPSEKDDSDQALATEKLFADGAEEIVVIGGLGGRMDHELANMMELVRAGREGRSIVYWDDINRLRYIGPGKHEIARTDDYIGIVPFSDDGMVGCIIRWTISACPLASPGSSAISWPTAPTRRRSTSTRATACSFSATIARGKRRRIEGKCAGSSRVVYKHWQKC